MEKILEIELTLRCPLRCLHCSVRGGEGKFDLDYEVYKKLIPSAKNVGFSGVDLIGGEPLLHPNIWDIISFTRKYMDYVAINTAGFFVTEKHIEKMVEVGVSEVFVSIDGPDRETYKKIRGDYFEKAINATKLMAKFLNVKVAFVASSLTYDKIPEMADLCRSLGVNKMFVLGFIPEGRGKLVSELQLKPHHIRKIIEDVNKIHDIKIELDCSIMTDFSSLPEDIPLCPAGTYFATVTVLGDVFPCGFLREHKDFCCGNIYIEDFEYVWRKKVFGFDYFRKPLDGCKSCGVYNICRGGCQARKLAKACEPHKTQYVKFIRDLFLRKNTPSPNVV